MNRANARRASSQLKCAAHPGFKILFFPTSWSFASSMSLCGQARPTAREQRFRCPAQLLCPGSDLLFETSCSFRPLFPRVNRHCVRPNPTNRGSRYTHERRAPALHFTLNQHREECWPFSGSRHTVPDHGHSRFATQPTILLYLRQSTTANDLMEPPVVPQRREDWIDAEVNHQAGMLFGGHL